MDRRRSPRIRSRFDALVMAGAREGAGVLADISHSGARLEDCSEQPPVGTRVRLYVFAEPAPAFELEGVVVRHTETGFAIGYELHDAAIRARVDAVSELARTPVAS